MNYIYPVLSLYKDLNQNDVKSYDYLNKQKTNSITIIRGKKIYVAKRLTIYFKNNKIL